MNRTARRHPSSLRAATRVILVGFAVTCLVAASPGTTVHADLPTWTATLAADSSEHGVVVQGMFGTTLARSALTHGITQLNSTDMYVHEVSTWYDARAIVTDAIEPQVGRLTCNVRSSNGRSHKSTVAFHTNINLSTNQAYWNGVACHEFGHAGGLQHHAHSCLQNPASSTRTVLNADDKTVINSKY